jgi:hypothetical protein
VAEGWTMERGGRQFVIQDGKVVGPLRKGVTNARSD